jgi:uncharacterized protein YPO0396
MSIFGKIVGAIFGSSANAAEVTPVASSSPADAAKSVVSGAVAAATSAVTGAASTAASAAKPTVDVAAVLDKLDETSDDTLDWRVSIVDLMKLLKLDSSLKARKELATELKYTGDMGDSASMNVWLHKQVMTKLAENGGVVPADLKH